MADRIQLVVHAALTFSLLLPTTSAFARGRSEEGRGSENGRGGEREHGSGGGGDHHGADCHCGDHHGADRSYDTRGFVTVTNPNEATLEVLLDGALLGVVAPGWTQRFGPVEEGRRQIRVRFVGEGLQFPVFAEQVFVDRRHPARIVTPEVDAGLLTVRNAWVEPMTLTLNGRPIATLPPHAVRVLRVDAAFGTLALLTPSGATAMAQRVSLRALRSQEFALLPGPTGTVTVRNPSRQHSLEVLGARGEVMARLSPSEARTVVQPAGLVTLHASFRGSTFTQASVLSSPFECMGWTITLPLSAPLAVRNPNEFAVEVFAGDRLLGTVGGRDRTFILGVAAGVSELSVVVRSRRGAWAESVRVEVDPLSGGLLTVPRMVVADGRGSGDGSWADHRGGHHSPRQTADRWGGSSDRRGGSSYGGRRW